MPHHETEPHVSQIINVSSMSELNDALANATGGETILLAEGHYGDLKLSDRSGFDITFPSEVTIASADPENPAVFSGLSLEHAENLTLDGLTFDYEFQAGDLLWARTGSVVDSSNVIIRNSTFDGDVAEGLSDVDDGYPSGIGLVTRGSSDILIENNEVFNYHRGLIINECSDVILRGNDVHTIRSDGIDFAEVTGVLIEGNYIHDFRRSLGSEDHADMIQFHTAGTEIPSSDITIRGNHFDIGEGDFTQTIFMRNEEVDQSRAGHEMFYANVTIEDNVIVNAHTNGIYIGAADGLTISNNSVLHADGSKPDGADTVVEIPRISVASNSMNVTVTQNITSDLNGIITADDWTVRDNAIVQDQDPLAAGYYADVFITSSLTTTGEIHSYLAIPGGTLDRMNAGASATHDLTTAPELTARFHVTESDDSAALYHFDAAGSTDGSAALPEGTLYRWFFDDGTMMVGEKVSYAFETGGVHDAILVVTLPDGQTIKADLAVTVPGSNLVSYDTSNGLVTYDEPDEQQGPEISASSASSGIVLEDRGVSLRVDREHVVDIVGQDEFTISLTLQANTLQDSGEVMRLNGSFVLGADRNGEVYLRAFNEDGGQTRLTTRDANINDGGVHDIQINYMDGVVSIDVNGETLASTEMDTPLRGANGHDLVFGSPWGGNNFESTVTAFDITVNASDFEAAAQMVQGDNSVPDMGISSISVPLVDSDAETAIPIEQPFAFATLDDMAPPQEGIAPIQGGVLTPTASEDLAAWHIAQFTAEEQTGLGARECATDPAQDSSMPNKTGGNLRPNQDAQDAFETMMLLGASETFIG